MMDDLMGLFTATYRASHINDKVHEEAKRYAQRLTFAMIKPDVTSTGHAGEVLSAMERWFTVTDVLCTQWPRNVMEEFYGHHREKPYFSELMDFMTSDRVYAVVLRGPEDGSQAVQSWRDLIGATDPRKADSRSIRARFGNKDGIIMRNAVHGSDSLDSAMREIDLVNQRLCGNFGDVAVDPIVKLVDGV